MRTWHDKNIQSNGLTTKFNHSASLAKWLSICVWPKWLWVRITLESLQISLLLRVRISLTFRYIQIHSTIECWFTLKCVCETIRAYSQMHHTDTQLQHSSIIWPVRPNGWVFVYEVSGYGFGSHWSHINFRYRTCFKQGVPWHLGNYRVWIHSKMRTWHDKNIQSNTPYK